jgi:hypothetical protein
MRRVLAALVLCAAVACVPSTALAAGGWSAPIPLGPPGSTNANVAVDAFGNVFAVWRAGSELRAAARPPGGAFGPSFLVGTNAADDGRPAVLVAPRGELVVAWADRDQRVNVRWGPIGGELGPAQVVGAGVWPDLVADGLGTVLLTFKPPHADSPTPVQVSERPLNGRFGPPRQFGEAWGMARIATNLAGQAAVLWSPRDSSVQMATRGPGGEWRPPERVPFSYETLMGANVDVDEAGTIYVAASPFAGGPFFRAWLLRRTPAGWSSEETLDADGMLQGFVVQPSGAATFAFWHRTRDDGRGSLTARFRDPAGAVSPSQPLADIGALAGIADGPRGDVLATLVSETADGVALLVAERLEGTPFDAPVTLDHGDDVHGGFPATSASGAAAVGWLKGALGQEVFTVSVRDAPGGLLAAAGAHAEALGTALVPVVEVPKVPPLPVQAPSIKVPVICSETCSVGGSFTVGGTRVRSRTLRLAPGRRGSVSVRVTRRLRRALRNSRRIRFAVRANGYSRRRATRRGAVRVRR